MLFCQAPYHGWRPGDRYRPVGHGRIYPYAKRKNFLGKRLLFPLSPADHSGRYAGVVAEYPAYIHILYGWTSSTAMLAAGDRFAVVVADDPRYGSRITSLDLAREIINSLGYQPRLDNDAAYNLLHHSATGDNMSDDQINTFWDVVNKIAQPLKSISCAPEE